MVDRSSENISSREAGDVAKKLEDVAAKTSDRPDHGPLGAHDGWLAGTEDAMSHLGYPDAALAFYRRLTPVTYEGCWAQAHELWGDGKWGHHARVPIPERAWIARDASAGIDMSQNVPKNFFGFYPSIDGDALNNGAKRPAFSGTLYNVLYAGKYYRLTNREGRVTLMPMEGKLTITPMDGVGAQPVNKVSLSAPAFSVEEATDWTDLFTRSSGWYGADGIYTIPLNGKKQVEARDSEESMLVFSDTMIGDSGDSQSAQRGNMVHNSVGFLHGGKAAADRIRFYWNRDDSPTRCVTSTQRTTGLSRLPKPTCSSSLRAAGRPLRPSGNWKPR